jgi:metal-responsive CopG/Arc/MetJ family transcriptional regulator
MIRRKTQKEQDFVRLNINLPRDLKERFIAVAKENDTDSSKLMRRWIKNYLSENSQTKMDF